MYKIIDTLTEKELKLLKMKKKNMKIRGTRTFISITRTLIEKKIR